MPHDAGMPQATELIGSTEAARILGQSPRTVHRLVAAGTLVPTIVAPGGRAGAYLFERSDVEQLADAKASA